MTTSALCLLLLTGCMKGLDKTTSLPRWMNSAEYQARPTATGSLFSTDEAVLSGASIDQILGSRVVVPKQARLAILQFGQRPLWQWWSEDLAQLNMEMEKSLMARLRGCPRLVDVRTGIVPFSSVSAQEYLTKKGKDDYGFAETVAKAEMKATVMGLEEVADTLVKFLETVD